jgi:hypothetical protein
VAASVSLVAQWAFVGVAEFVPECQLVVPQLTIPILKDCASLRVRDCSRREVGVADGALRISQDLLPERVVRAVCVCCSEAVARVHVLRDPPGAEQGFQAGGCLCCASASCSSCGARVSGSFVYYAVRRGIVSAECSLWELGRRRWSERLPIWRHVSQLFRCRPSGRPPSILDWALLPVCSLFQKVVNALKGLCGGGR